MLDLYQLCEAVANVSDAARDSSRLTSEGRPLTCQRGARGIRDREHELVRSRIHPREAERVGVSLREVPRLAPCAGQCLRWRFLLVVRADKGQAGADLPRWVVLRSRGHAQQ